MGKIYDYEKESMSKPKATSGNKGSIDNAQNKKRDTTQYIGGVNPEIHKNHNGLKKTTYNKKAKLG